MGAKRKGKTSTAHSHSASTSSQTLLYVSFLLVVAAVVVAYVQTSNVDLDAASESAAVSAVVLAAQTPTNRAFPVECDPRAYTPAVPGCMPVACSRHVMDNFTSASEAASLVRLAERALAYGGGSGGVSIFDLESGALSYRDRFVNLYRVVKNISEALPESELTVYRAVRERIRQKVVEAFALTTDLSFTTPAFFSRMTSEPAKTMNDEYWHDHIDAVTYPSFTYTALLYLNAQGRDFDGGEFAFDESDEGQGASLVVAPQAGRLSFFTSGHENPHRVRRVTRGVRWALTTSFTCKTK